MLLSRTLLSGLSSAVNLLAGGSHYRRRAFVLYDVAGRLVWSALYLGIGYGFARRPDLVGELLDDVLRLLASLELGSVPWRLFLPDRTG